MSRNYFGKLLSSSTTTPPPKSKIVEAKRTLLTILRTYTIISLPLLSIGPTLAPLLLSLIAGPAWRSSGAGAVLSTYCYYIPLLALNGLLEAFVSSVSSEAEINRQTLWMVGFTACFASSAVLFLRILDMSAQGLVWANALNMGLRIVWCGGFIRGYMSRFGEVVGVADVLPKGLSVAGAVATAAFMGQLKTTFTGGAMDIIKSGVVSVTFVVVL